MRVVHFQQPSRRDTARAQIGEVPVNAGHRLTAGGRVALDDPPQTSGTNIATQVFLRRVLGGFCVGNRMTRRLPPSAALSLWAAWARCPAPGEEVENEVVGPQPICSRRSIKEADRLRKLDQRLSAFRRHRRIRLALRCGLLPSNGQQGFTPLTRLTASEEKYIRRESPTVFHLYEIRPPSASVFVTQGFYSSHQHDPSGPASLPSGAEIQHLVRSREALLFVSLETA